MKNKGLKIKKVVKKKIKVDVKIEKKVIKKSSKTFGKIIEISDEKRLKKSAQKPIIEIRNLNVVFGKKQTAIHAVKDLSLNVYKGEVVGIVGESGSGKSTTGNAIMGLVDRQSGTLKIKSREIPAKVSKIKGDIHKFMVKTVQMIFQDPATSLNPYKTIFKVVSEGLMNINVNHVFAKTFDGITAKTLSNLLKGKKQPTIIGKISLEWVTSEIDEDRFDKVMKVLYFDSIKALYKMNSDYSIKAADYLRMRKNIREDFLDGNSSRKKVIEKLVVDVIESVGLSQNMLSAYPLEFSGGQQQRVGISRAVVLKPEIIVADEPISALDVSIQAQVVNIFNELKDKLNLTIIFIAHDLRMVEYISDRIIVMYRGKVVESGAASEIVNNPIHPYTKSLINSIPTIDKVHKSLRSRKYDEKQHEYDETKQPSWFSVPTQEKKEHFVLGTHDEVEEWRSVEYE